MKEFEVKDGVLIKYCGNDKNVVIPDNIREIGESAFEKCNIISSVKIGKEVKVIGEKAFYYCGSLKEVIIPDSVEIIGRRAFVDCIGLKEITVPGSVKKIGEKAFFGCKNLMSVKICEGVEVIEREAFSCCFKLKNIDIADSVGVMGRGTFFLCGEIEKVHIPENVKVIDKECFMQCKGLNYVYFNSDNVLKLDNDAFHGCVSLKEIRIPANLATIGHGVFSGCVLLKEVIIPESTKELGKEIFRSCNDTVVYTSLPISAWSGTSDKKTVLNGFLKLWDKGESIDEEIKKAVRKYVNGQRKRLYDIALTDILLMKYMAEEKIITLQDCDMLVEKSQNTEIKALLLEYSKNNFTSEERTAEMFKEINKNPFSAKELKKIYSVKKNDNNTLTITSYKGNDTEVIVPEKIGNFTVTAIGAAAFSVMGSMGRYSKERESIVSVKLPETITKIEETAFYWAKNLKEINIPQNVTTIGKNAFSDCVSLKSITLPKKLKKIGEYAFMDCKALEEINIPENMQEIEDTVFKNCPKVILKKY